VKLFTELVKELTPHTDELFPWDLTEQLDEGRELLIVDVREPYEYDKMHIRNSINVPRGILETACEWNYEETVPELVQAREEQIVVVCRSGNRSIFAAHTMQRMGYKQVSSLRTGLRGWNDYEQELICGHCSEDGVLMDIEVADEYFSAGPTAEQMKPRGL
jgi:rhodanese-related sulfurtransferase